MKDRRGPPLRWPTAVGLVVALGGPGIISALSPRIAGSRPDLSLQVLLQLSFCGLAVFVVVVVLRLERLPVQSIGLRRPAIEETLYRGYAVERLAAVTGRRSLGAILATLAFAAAHIPAWGLGFALVADLPAGIVLVLFYLWRRDLVANMLAHSAGLIVAMFTIVP